VAADHAQGADTQVENSRNYRPQGQQWTTIEGLVEEGHSNRIDMIEPGTNPKIKLYILLLHSDLSYRHHAAHAMRCPAQTTTLKSHTCCHPGRQRKSREQRALSLGMQTGTSFGYSLDSSVLQD